MMKLYWLVRGLRVLMYAALGLGLFSGLIMTLWNWLVPTLFGGPGMNFAQALGLLLLTRLLLGRLRGRPLARPPACLLGAEKPRRASPP
jgi:hypothetical protein